MIACCLQLLSSDAVNDDADDDDISRNNDDYVIRTKNDDHDDGEMIFPFVELTPPAAQRTDPRSQSLTPIITPAMGSR